MATLADLKPGQSGIIKNFQNALLTVKLLEMGCLPGERVEMVHRAPLGDPISIKVAGYILSLRKSEARLVEIDPVPAFAS